MAKIHFKILFLFLIISLCVNIAQAENETNISQGVLRNGDYLNFEYEKTIHPSIITEIEYNCTHNTNETNNTQICINKTEYTLIEKNITQPKQKIPDTPLIPYEPVDFEAWENITDQEIISQNISNNITNETQPEANMTIQYTPATHNPNILIENMIFIIVIVTLFVIIKKIIKLKKEIKQEKEKTPEDRAKELLDAGHNEEYVEEIYNYIKKEEQKNE